MKCAKKLRDTVSITGNSNNIVHLLLVPVVVHVLHVVVVLEHVDELLHVLDVPGVGELDVVLGDHLHLGGKIVRFYRNTGDFFITSMLYLGQKITHFASVCHSLAVFLTIVVLYPKFNGLSTLDYGIRRGFLFY